MCRTSAPTAVFLSFRTTSLGIPAFLAVLMSSLKPRASLPTSSPSLPQPDSLPVLTGPSLPRPAQPHCKLPLCSPPHKSTAVRITARSTGTAAWGRRKKTQNKTQDNFTERHRSHIQTPLFWDAIHLCNRAGISQTPLRPEICSQSHTQRLLPSAL